MTRLIVTQKDRDSFQLTTPRLKAGVAPKLPWTFNINLTLASNPSLLPKLRGAPLTVLNALALRADQDGQCFPGIRTICKDTGYSDKTVDTALDKLEKLGLISRIKRSQTSTLYQLTPVEIPLAESGKIPTPHSTPVGKTPTLTESSDGKFPTPVRLESGETPTGVGKIPTEDVVVVQDTTKDIQQHTVTSEKFRKVSENLRSSPEKNPSGNYKQVAIDEWLAIQAELKAVGYDDRTAEKLVTIQKQKGRTPAWSTALLKYFRDQKSLENPLGWLWRALTADDWSLPGKYLAALQTVDPFQKYVVGYEGIVEY